MNAELASLLLVCTDEVTIRGSRLLSLLFGSISHSFWSYLCISVKPSFGLRQSLSSKASSFRPKESEKPNEWKGNQEWQEKGGKKEKRKRIRVAKRLAARSKEKTLWRWDQGRNDGIAPDRRQEERRERRGIKAIMSERQPRKKNREVSGALDETEGCVGGECGRWVKEGGRGCISPNSTHLFAGTSIRACVCWGN